MGGKTFLIPLFVGASACAGQSLIIHGVGEFPHKRGEYFFCVQTKI